MAVIGAGPAGLAAVKELLDEGLDPVCFERAEGLGGVFRYSEDDGVVWESCRLTSSGLLTVFSDFPDPSGLQGHLTAAEYIDYLSAYADHFGVTSRIRFGANVEAVERLDDALWRVTWIEKGERLVESFRAVAVCSGLHQHPYVPAFPGLESWTGELLHAASYRRPTQVRGRKVLIVGAGESGADVAAEVARNAEEAALSLRRGVAVQPRRMFGVPKDYLTSRLLNSASHWVFQTRNPADDRKRIVYRSAFIPLVVIDKVLQLTYRFFWEYLPLWMSRRPAEVRSNLRTRKLTVELLGESGGTVTEQFGTKTDDFVRAIAEGQCRRFPAIERFEGSRVVFSDGTSWSPDLVLLCTGFETKVPFLPPQIVANQRFMHVFSPSVGPTLGFIGFLRPAFGAIPPLAELQARWFALVTSGRVQLPGEGAMRESIEYWTGYRAHVFRAVRERLEHLVDHTPFCDALAAQIGCKPSRADLKRESLRFRYRFWAAPFVAAQYRLVGPHSKAELARRVIDDLPVTHPLPDLVNLWMRWSMTRILHRVLGADYAPKLVLD
ncbi:MAG: flavin-containing monooxygenase [Gemmatimonadota bacterium]